MSRPEVHFDEWAANQAGHRVTRSILENRHPLFESAREFGLFVSIVREEQERPHCSGSWMGGVLDVLKLGGRVQTSRRRPSMPARPERYHARWIDRLLRAVTMEAGYRALEAWKQYDVVGRTVRGVAEYQDVGRSTAHRLIREGRTAVVAELDRQGRMNQRRPRRVRRRVRAVRAVG